MYRHKSVCRRHVASCRAAGAVGGGPGGNSAPRVVGSPRLAERARIALALAVHRVGDSGAYGRPRPGRRKADLVLTGAEREQLARWAPGEDVTGAGPAGADRAGLRGGQGEQGRRRRAADQRAQRGQGSGPARQGRRAAVPQAALRPEGRPRTMRGIPGDLLELVLTGGGIEGSANLSPQLPE
jgi:hypothetical protein